MSFRSTEPPPSHEALRQERSVQLSRSAPLIGSSAAAGAVAALLLQSFELVVLLGSVPGSLRPDHLAAPLLGFSIGAGCLGGTLVGVFLAIVEWLFIRAPRARDRIYAVAVVLASPWAPACLSASRFVLRLLGVSEAALWALAFVGSALGVFIAVRAASFTREMRWHVVSGARRTSRAMRLAPYVSFAWVASAYWIAAHLPPDRYVAFRTTSAVSSFLLAEWVVAVVGVRFTAARARANMRGSNKILMGTLAVALSVGGYKTASGHLAEFNAVRTFVARRTIMAKHVLATYALLGFRPQGAALPANCSTGLNEAGGDAAAIYSNGPRNPPPEASTNADVVLISIDTLRADHLGAYGYPRATSPNIDAFARNAVVFDNAFSAATRTIQSLTGLLTGRSVSRIAQGTQLVDQATITSALKRAGYTTAAFFPAGILARYDALGLGDIAQRKYDFEFFEQTDATAHTLGEAASSFVTASGSEPLFLWVHFLDPHAPYLPHDEPFGHLEMDHYDAEIRFTDEAVGALLQTVRQARPHAIIVLTADHGEEFYDHGGLYHGDTLYREQNRVPLMLEAPGVTPKRVLMPVQSVDVAPTLAEMVGVRLDRRVQGRSLLRVVTETGALEAKPLFVEVGQYKKVMHLGNELICDTDAGFCELYDLLHDPGEQRNLIDIDLDKRSELKNMLGRWVCDKLAVDSASLQVAP